MRGFVANIICTDTYVNINNVSVYLDGKDATEFIVSVIDNKVSRVGFSNILKPILEQLGNTNSLKFLITRGKIIIRSMDDRHC